MSKHAWNTFLDISRKHILGWGTKIRLLRVLKNMSVLSYFEYEGLCFDTFGTFSGKVFFGWGTTLRVLRVPTETCIFIV